MKRTNQLIFSTLVLACSLLPAQNATDEGRVWSREEEYWRYVKANELAGYRSLWREDFLGWPMSSPEPARKAQITSWITAQTSTGNKLESYVLERLSVQVSDNVATTTYRVKQTWIRADGASDTRTTRILHTWLRESDGTWRIISGMSAPVDRDGH